MGDPRMPVIDLFAGPGGLGEGFSASGNQQRFKIALSVEMDPVAHQTLQLRAFFRQFGSRSEVPAAYYAHLRGEITREALFASHREKASAAEDEAWQATLGEVPRETVNERIRAALRRFGEPDDWVLIGGPPCQAYSLAGRSRNKGKEDYVAEEDHRQFLYLEYLQIIADHAPPVFVMENVKGLLSATVANQRMFDRIQADLRDPATALAREHRPKPLKTPKYVIRSLNPAGTPTDSPVEDFVVRCERYGIPQARHRVILLGIRSDLADRSSGTLNPVDAVTVKDAIGGMPKLRCGISKISDKRVKHTKENWVAALDGRWTSAIADRNVRDVVEKAAESLMKSRLGQGGAFVSSEPPKEKTTLSDWYGDANLGGLCNHWTRTHMDSDIRRYLFVASFAEVHARSPELVDFPAELLPAHRNVAKALDGAMFADRFRVQLWDKPSTTVVSHISKDGHYYIHPDPRQCRSLTVREAARLQTFPDNYLFCGGRTDQYHQVGNAVPPLLAKQIADIVYDLLKSK